MTTAIPTQPLTAAAFLFGDTKEDSVDALAHALHEQGVLGTLGEGVTKLSRAGRNAANDQIATVAHGLLDLDLGGLVIAGWGKYADLSAAAKRTFATPDSSEVVELATHTITSTHRPFVDLLVNDAHVATVHFELSVKFVVKGLVATVQHGRLVALSGGCDVAATLTAEGRQLARRAAPSPPAAVAHRPDFFVARTSRRRRAEILAFHATRGCSNGPPRRSTCGVALLGRDGGI